MLEQLQPSWLQNWWQRFCYLLLSRLLQSCTVIPLMAVLNLILIDLSFFLIVEKTSSLPQSLVTTTITMALSSAIGESFLNGRKSNTYAFWGFVVWMYLVNFPAVQLLGLGSLAALILVFRAGRGFEHDIQCTERLTWSWRGFLRGFVFHKILSIDFKRRIAETNWLFGIFLSHARLLVYIYYAAFFIVQLVLTFLTLTGDAKAREYLILTLSVNCASGIASAISSRAIQTKISANEGIRQSARNSLVFFGLTLLFALIFSLVGYWWNGPQGPPSWVGLICYVLLGLGSFSGAWFGGADAVAHYALRLILYISGCAPLKYALFLDYAADKLGFLQKVGGGYIFMHRYLLEYFATLEEAPAVAKSLEQAKHT